MERWWERYTLAVHGFIRSVARPVRIQVVLVPVFVPSRHDQHPAAMHAMLLPLVLTCAQPHDPPALHVVVYTSDEHVMEYRCRSTRVDTGDPLAVPLDVQRTPGRVDWHASGGTPPYRMVADDRDAFGNVCITVVDATGQVGRGCGVVGRRLELVTVECQDHHPAAPYNVVQVPRVRKESTGQGVVDREPRQPRMLRELPHRDRGTATGGGPSRDRPHRDPVGDRGVRGDTPGGRGTTGAPPAPRPSMPHGR